MTFRTLAAGAVSAVLLALPSAAQGLGVGDPAPKLKLAGWLRGEPIDSFEPQRVYVVEFWATWCVPCRRTIPHLSGVQDRFGPKGVRVVGVSVWEDDQAEVGPYVEGLGTTLRYSVALDHVLEGATPMQGTMALSWLRAAGENSLPTAFIVDGGRIAWIGDTLSLEKPLEQIVAGKWDLEAAKLAHQRRIATKKLDRKLYDQLKQQRWEEALATIAQMQELAPESEARTAPWRFQALLSLGRNEQAYAYAAAAVDELLWDDALALNLVAWFVVDPAAKPPAARNLDFALRVAARAAELSEARNPAILDTLALVHFERGEVARALELQEKAVELAKDTSWLDEATRAELVERLERFRAATKKAPERSGKLPTDRELAGG
jgi:thiol-disulfide isomerase/thioredoxin